MCKNIIVNNMQLVIIYLIFQRQLSDTFGTGKPNKHPPVVLMNLVKDNEVSEVKHVKVIDTFV